MALPIRPQDLTLACSVKNEDRNLDLHKTPDAMIAHCLGQAQLYGVQVVEKPKRSRLRMSKFSTTFYKQIRLVHGFYDRSKRDQARTLAHELVHVRQWRSFGRVRYALSYLGERFRWAMEMQAYAESVRAMVILRFPQSQIEWYANTKWKSIITPYRLGRIDRTDLERSTTYVLRSAMDHAP